MKKQKITPVMLAKDVLAYLDPKKRGKIRIFPRFGTGYLNVLREQPTHGGPVLYDYSVEGGSDVQKILKKGKPCQVCALGALVAAKAVRADEVQTTYGGVLFGNDVYAALEEVFRPRDLAKIEQAFEDGCCWEVAPNDSEGAKERLIQICKNIIKNKGKFRARNARA